ncbi:MAG: tetratricopeptide repeat protein [Candidatus Brocadiia bacterium]|nr:MAG: tetratricopeptide repeat protein [Candidatus Brocadiia bacterium]
MIDVELFGPEAGWFHLVNVLLHIANTLLLLAVLKKMTGSLWPSTFVAAVFAIHPMHVESVAWIAERKDVLSTFFFLLTLAAYTGYAQSRSVHRYLLSLVLFAMGLMAKPMLVTLPFVLLLLDYWPLERMKFGADDKKSFPWPKLILEKIPFLVLSVASSVITFLVQRSGGSMKGVEIFSIKARVLNAAVAYFEYIKKMFWPSKLGVFYPHPGENISTAKAAVCIIVLIGLTVLILYLGRKRKYLATGWLWYLGTLVPVIGLVQFGDQSMADRYAYIPLTGLLIMIAWGVPELISKLPYRKAVLGLSMAMVLTASAICSHQQVRFWENSVTLFRHALDVTQNNYLACYNLGDAYCDLGLYREAIEAYKQAIKIKPIADTYNNLGFACCGIGRYQEAIEAFKQVIRIKPDAIAYNNLGVAYGKSGRYQEAIEAYKQAIKLKQDFADAHFGLGLAYLKSSDKTSALQEYKILKTLDAAMAEKLLNMINK